MGKGVVKTRRFDWRGYRADLPATVREEKNDSSQVSPDEYVFPWMIMRRIQKIQLFFNEED